MTQQVARATVRPANNTHNYILKKKKIGGSEPHEQNVLKLCQKLRLFRVIEFCDISNGDRTERSPIRSVIIRVITKSEDRTAGVRFVYQHFY